MARRLRAGTSFKRAIGTMERWAIFEHLFPGNEIATSGTALIQGGTPEVFFWRGK